MAILLPPSLAMHASCTNYNNFHFKKEQTILMLAKYNHKCLKKINLLSSRWCFKMFLNFKIFLLKMKTFDKLGLCYHRYILGLTSSSYRESIAVVYTKILYYQTIAIINKCFKFQNDWLKITHIRYNWMQFYLYHCFKEIKNFRTTAEPFERYTAKSNQHQITSRCNWI